MRIINIIEGILAMVFAPVIIILAGAVGIIGAPIGLLYAKVRDNRGGSFTTPLPTQRRATLVLKTR
jgi:hypothetical protein